MPQFDHKYIGISTVMDEYVLPSDNEFYKCITTPVCLISTPFVKMDSQNLPCEIETMKLKQYKCKFDAVKDWTPVYITYNNKTYYSVGNRTGVYIKCPKQGTHESSTIEGLGVIETPADCPVSIAPFSIRPPNIHTKDQLQHNELFKILPSNDSDLISYIPEPAVIHTPPPPIELLNHTSISDTIKVLFDKTTVKSNLAQIFALLLGITCILILLCMISKHFRLWIKGCCFITKPSVYWNKVRGYEVPTFRKPQTQLSNTYVENPQPQPEDVVPMSSLTFTYDQPNNLLSTLWNMQETIGQTRRQVTKEGLGLYPQIDDEPTNPDKTIIK